jgi:hypothetical protein
MDWMFNRQSSLAQALANARTDNRPRYVHFYDGRYWISISPPKSSWAGVFPENVDVVYVDGHMENYGDVLSRELRKERLNAHRTRNRQADEARAHRNRPAAKEG